MQILPCEGMNLHVLALMKVVVGIKAPKHVNLHEATPSDHVGPFPLAWSHDTDNPRSPSGPVWHPLPQALVLTVGEGDNAPSGVGARAGAPQDGPSAPVTVGALDGDSCHSGHAYSEPG